MRTRRIGITALASLVLTVGVASRGAAGDHPSSPAPEPKPFTTLKTLAGTWQGNVKMGDKTVPVTIVYESTAAGSAVLERLFPGTPHEMISVYTAAGDGVAMTHYCALGNHPRMTLRKADARSLAFELAGSDGLRAATEPHMHAMTVAFVDADHIRETWTSFDKGQLKEEKVFELARKK